jgi:hypothetical protein
LVGNIAMIISGVTDETANCIVIHYKEEEFVNLLIEIGTKKMVHGSWCSLQKLPKQHPMQLSVVTICASQK